MFHAQFSGWEVFLKDGWATDTFVTNYLPLALFPILYIGAKLYCREPIKTPHEMDFITNVQEIEAETYVAESICYWSRAFCPENFIDTTILLLEIEWRRRGNGW